MKNAVMEFRGAQPPKPIGPQSDLVLDEESMDYHGMRFLAAAYRTTRAILMSRFCLVEGQTLNESFYENTKNIFESTAAFSRNSILDILNKPQGTPALPRKDSSPTEIEDISIMHGYVAMRLGYSPGDPCLHWFDRALISEWMPSAEQLLRYEAELVTDAGEVLVSKGRIGAMCRLSDILGKPSAPERSDWAALPMAYVRDLAVTTTEDDRALMVARLEDLAQKAQNNLDLKTELTALRTLATIQGLTFFDDNKSEREMLHFFKSRSPERSIEAGQPKSSQGKPTIQIQKLA